MKNQEFTRKPEEKINNNIDYNNIDIESEIEREFTTSTISSIRVKSGLVYTVNIENENTMMVEDLNSNYIDIIENSKDNFQQKIKETYCPIFSLSNNPCISFNIF